MLIELVLGELGVPPRADGDSYGLAARHMCQVKLREVMRKTGLVANGGSRG